MGLQISRSIHPEVPAVSSVVGFIKGKSAISVARNFRGRRRNFTGESFWARGYFVSTVSLDEEMVTERGPTSGPAEYGLVRLVAGEQDRPL